MIDIQNIKTELITLLNSGLNPRCTTGDTTYSNFTVCKLTFYPLQTSITSVSLYANTKSETASEVRIYTDYETLYENKTYSFVAGKNDFAITSSASISSRIPITVEVKNGGDLKLLGSKTRAITVKNFTIDTNTNATGMLCLDFAPPKNLVKPVYPIWNLSPENLPLITLDVVARIKARQRYLDVNRLEQTLRISILVFSKYASEIDDLACWIENILCRNRTLVMGIFLLTPEQLGDLYITGTTNDVLSRNITYTADIFAQNQF